MTGLQNEHIKNIEEKVESMNVKVDNFQRKLERAPSKTAREYRKTIKELEAKRDRVEKKLNALKDATGNSFRDMQIGAEMAWEDLKSAYNSAKERYENAA